MVHKRLTRDLTLLVLGLFILFLFIGYLYSRQLQNEFSFTLFDSTRKLVINKNKQFIDPITRSLELSRKWAELQSLSTNQHDLLNERFIPILETLPQLSAVMIASTDGKMYFLSRSNNDWLSRHIDKDEYGVNQVKWQLWDKKNQLVKSWQEKSDYQLQDRPWFQLGMDSKSLNDIQWTSPYSFYTQQVPGITGVTRWQDRDNQQYILAFDVTLPGIAQNIAKATVYPDDITFLISPNGEIILPPGKHPDIKGSSEVGSLYVPGEVEDHIIFDTIAHWNQTNRPLNQPASFSKHNRIWRYKIFVLEGYKNSVFAGIIVPEKKLIDIINENIAFLFSVIAVFILLAVFISRILVRKYAHQLRDLPKTSISKSDFSNEIYRLLREGESETLEFKSTMRKNLKTGKNGKEIEIAWLKGLVGFMNSKGGILLIGIDDDSNILGIEADEFANEDKLMLHFKNLISQHIGLEFSKFINLAIGTIDDKTIIVVECERADRPVFLHNKNEEAFYIRSGPASVNLSISKVIRYIENRY